MLMLISFHCRFSEQHVFVLFMLLHVEQKPLQMTELHLFILKSQILQIYNTDSGNNL